MAASTTAGNAPGSLRWRQPIPLRAMRGAGDSAGERQRDRQQLAALPDGFVEGSGGRRGAKARAESGCGKRVLARKVARACPGAR